MLCDLMDNVYALLQLLGAEVGEIVKPPRQHGKKKIIIMAEVQLPKGIVAIRGRLGDFVYRTRKQADGTYKTFVHYSPKVKK